MCCARQSLGWILWVVLLAGCIPPMFDPDPVHPTTTAPPPKPPEEPPSLAPLEAIPKALRDAHDLLSQGYPADAAQHCEEVFAHIRGEFLTALRWAQIDGPAANAQRVRELLAEHFYATPPLLALARDRFVLAPEPARLCLRAAWLAGREDLKVLWREDLEDGLQAASSPAQP